MSFLFQPEGNWTKNLALGKPTKGSTNQLPSEASNAVDGNRNANMAHGSCSSTSKAKGNWWQVDIGAVYEIQNVLITNRGDCCGKLNQTRLRRVTATVSVKI